MIKYKGDIFVVGKKFKLQEKEYVFKKRTNKGYVFINEGKEVVIPENSKELKEMI